jgi:hypothetical protein
LAFDVCARGIDYLSSKLQKRIVKQMMDVVLAPGTTLADLFTPLRLGD